MGTAGGAGRLSDIDFSVDHIWEGEVRDGSRECEGDVKDDVRGRAVAGEVKEEERDLLPVVGREEGEGERGEVKENCGADLFAGGENRLSGGTFVHDNWRVDVELMISCLASRCFNPLTTKLLIEMM